MGKWDDNPVARRDFRSSREAPEVPKHRRTHRSGKCRRAKDGRHDFVHAEKVWVGTTVIPLDRCAHCGKENWTDDTWRAIRPMTYA